MKKERFQQAVEANGMTMAILLFFFVIPEGSKKEITFAQWQEAYTKGVLSNEDRELTAGILKEMVRCARLPKEWSYLFVASTGEDKLLARQHLEEVVELEFWEKILAEHDQILGNKDLLALAKEKVRQAYAAEE